MKKLITILAGVAAVLGCFSQTTKALDLPKTGITTNFTPVQISITVITNGISEDTNGVASQSVHKAKIDNNTLLKIFAHWDGSNAWPAGTKLVIGWDWDGQLLVVDKTGTNVLYNPEFEYGDFIFPSVSRIEGPPATNYFYLDLDDYGGPNSYKYVDKSSGSVTGTRHDFGYFELYDDNVYLPYTDLYGYGNSTINYTQNWKMSGPDTNVTYMYTTWTQKAEMKAAESSSTWMNKPAQVKASLNTSGSGKGENTWNISE